MRLSSTSLRRFSSRTTRKRLTKGQGGGGGYVEVTRGRGQGGVHRGDTGRKELATRGTRVKGWSSPAQGGGERRGDRVAHLPVPVVHVTGKLEVVGEALMRKEGLG